MVRQTGLASDVNHPTHAEGGVNDEPNRGRRSSRGTELKDVVDEYLRLRKVDEDVVDRLADDAGRERPVHIRERPDRIPVELDLEIELLAVEFLERVAGSRRPAWLGGGPHEESQRHAYDDGHCAQGSFHNAIVNPDLGKALRKAMETFAHPAPSLESSILRARASNQSSPAMIQAAPEHVTSGWSPI
ncbi:MAG TPA: hypothetical protein VGG68_07735 [Caulobacteraceae bacterium]|jgi:hypothetical protein